MRKTRRARESTGSGRARAGRRGPLRPRRGKKNGPGTLRSRSQILGVGVRHSLFPGGTRLGALAFAGGVLPDATLRGMRMYRSHGGTVLTVAGRDLSSEASAPGSVAPCRGRRAGRGADTSAIQVLASAPLPRGRRQLLAGRWPRVTGLTSYLSGCIRSCSGVTCFFTPPRRGGWTNFARFARSPRSCRPCAPFS